MIRIIRSHILRDLVAARAELAEREQAAQAAAEALRSELEEQFNGLQAVVKQTSRERDAARAERDRYREEAEAARAQVLLDAEDRVTLRALLRAARKQNARADRVYALFRSGALHSVHATADAAEEAAEAEGAPRSGWAAQVPGAAVPSAAEVPWRIQPLALGGGR